MRKFIIKSSFFIVPFLLLYFLNITLYNQNEGDLARLGFLYNNPSPKSEVSKQFSLKKQYALVSDLDFHKKEKFDVFTIGDSFSEQDSLGYQNFLANEGVSVLHLDRFLADNPIQRLIELINGVFFDSIQVDYVVLQSVERAFLQRFQSIDYTKSFHIDSIKYKIKKRKEIISKRTKINKGKNAASEEQLDFFADATLKIPLINIQYSFYNKSEFSSIYKVATNKNNLFSGNPNNLLFYEDDVDQLDYKNDSLRIANANDVINTINELLSKKNIQLILLISPDKYHLYYPYIQDKRNFQKPLLFEYYKNLEKEYIYINSFEILSKELEKHKDLYYYDDTHWSPFATRIIGKEIKNKIEIDSLQN